MGSEEAAAGTGNVGAPFWGLLEPCHLGNVCCVGENPQSGVGIPRLFCSAECGGEELVQPCRCRSNALKHDKHGQVAGVTPPGLGTRSGRPDYGSC